VAGPSGIDDQDHRIIGCANRQDLARLCVFLDDEIIDADIEHGLARARVFDDGECRARAAGQLRVEWGGCDGQADANLETHCASDVAQRPRSHRQHYSYRMPGPRVLLAVATLAFL